MNNIYNYIVNYTQKNEIANTIKKIKKKKKKRGLAKSKPTSMGKCQPKFIINNRNCNHT